MAANLHMRPRIMGEMWTLNNSVYQLYQLVYYLPS